MENNGLRKLIAVASASGIIAAAANMQLTPAQPQNARPACTGQAAPRKLGRTQARIGSNTTSAKKNRPELTCRGCSASPSTPRPRTLAIRVVTAISAQHSIISAAPVSGRDAAGVTPPCQGYERRSSLPL